MTDTETVSPSSETVATDNVTAPLENSTLGLDSLVSTLTPDQLAAFIAAIPADTLRGLATNQEHPLGKITQSEADRRMESWRQTELRSKEAEKRQTDAAARAHWLDTAPDDEVAAKLREEQQLNRMSQQVQYQHFVTMFQELKSTIDTLTPDRRAKVQAFVESPGADEQWYKLPTLVNQMSNEQQREDLESKAKSTRETEDARRTAAAVSSAPPTDVGKGAATSAGKTTADLLRDPNSDIRSVAQALSDMGIKVPAKLLKKE